MACGCKSQSIPAIGVVVRTESLFRIWPFAQKPDTITRKIKRNRNCRVFLSGRKRGLRKRRRAFQIWFARGRRRPRDSLLSLACPAASISRFTARARRISKTRIDLAGYARRDAEVYNCGSNRSTLITSTQEAFDVPSEVELIEWFGCSPVTEREGRYRYQVSDNSNVSLVFSFDVIECSIQTVVTV